MKKYCQQSLVCWVFIVQADGHILPDTHSISGNMGLWQVTVNLQCKEMRED